MKIFSEYFNGHLEEMYKKERVKLKCKQDEILTCDLGCK
jgi:hypothetical protein